ncbi:uncharacterized protein [Triticum aestivum]|uniref:uncharacterized protein n=1 Tax=Triticum aestivum TaxID=4565 RepID=UPI001D009FD1|nr:uncharacterized protein LOC123039644 [Triticum aestivum]
MGRARAAKHSHAIRHGEAIGANLKRALVLFYNVTYYHSLISMMWIWIQNFADIGLSYNVSGQHDINIQVIDAYLHKTKQMCVISPASATSWNLITYGASLLDSSLPEDYADGGRVLTMLIDKDIPSHIRRLLIRSPRHRIQKLIGTLAWRSPEEREMRWHAVRIMEHLAGDINLAHFPGALECISSLFDQETLSLTFVAPQGTDQDLVLPGLRILENLAHDRHNCTLIYNTKDLLSKIVAPVSSDKLTEDIKNSAAWTKVVDGSLKVVSRLMGSSGSTGQDMCKQIADDNDAVKNLEAVLDMDMKSNDGIIELQMRAIEVLTQLVLHHPACTSAEELIKRALHIFLTADWMEDYLKDEKRKIEHQTTSHVQKKMKEAKETASRLKEQAGATLAMLSSDSEAIKSFTGCNDDVNNLTELLDTDIKTINCKISATDTVKIEISIACRISAAVILKHLSNYVKEPTLRKVLRQLLPVQQDEQSHSKHRRLQAPLLSLITVIRANSNLSLRPILMSQRPADTLEELVVRLKRMADNMYATPACLAIQKLTCQMVIDFMKDDGNVRVIDQHNIVGTLLKASEMMVGLENSILFSGVDPDCYGVPLRPFSKVLAKNAEDLLTQRKQALGINNVPAGFLQHDGNVEVIDRHKIIGALLEASNVIDGLESSMLFTGAEC